MARCAGSASLGRARQVIKLGDLHEFQHGRGWRRTVWVDGVEYIVGVEQGQRVRIAYKPRGPEGWGYWWHGFVNDAKGKRLWQAQVNKSTGARGLLRFAKLIGTCSSSRPLLHDWRAVCMMFAECMTYDESLQGFEAREVVGAQVDTGVRGLHDD